MGVRGSSVADPGEKKDGGASAVDVPVNYELVDGGPLAETLHGVSLLWCPACGYPFSYGEPRQKHIQDHDAEDFGL